MARNFHQQPFDEATQVKLDLFGRYIREWLPVFLNHKPPPEEITIVDFFAGPGRDSSGRLGSPLIALDEIRRYRGSIQACPSKVRLELNEFAKEKASQLELSLQSEQIDPSLCSWRVGSRSFEDAFQFLLPSLRTGPNLLLLDQQGVKFISDEVFKVLAELPQTDFMFFVASSTLRRFEDHPSIKKYFPEAGTAFSARQFNDTHRAVADYYRDLIRTDLRAKLFLGAFSLKKGSNIYGLIFGSSHPLGIEKFLRLSWNQDPVRGEANFDIDGERIDPDHPALFPEMNVPKKLQVFQRDLRTRVLSGELKTDGEVYVASLEAGFLPKHGKRPLVELIKEKRVTCEEGRQARVSSAGYRSPRRLRVIGSQ